MTSSLFFFQRKYDAQLRLNSINEHSFSSLFKIPISVTFFEQGSEREIHDFSFSFINCNSYSLSLPPLSLFSADVSFSQLTISFRAFFSRFTWSDFLERE